MQEDAQATGEWETIIERCLNGAADAGAGEPAGAADGGPRSERTRVPLVALASPSSKNEYGLRVRARARKQLVGVYIRCDCAPFPSRLRRAHRRDGHRGELGRRVLGNKGGAAVWLVHNTRCASCAPPQRGLQGDGRAEAVEDYARFTRSCRSRRRRRRRRRLIRKPSSVADAFAAVWIGDLNCLNWRTTTSGPALGDRDSGRARGLRKPRASFPRALRVRGGAPRAVRLAARRGPAVAGARRGRRSPAGQAPVAFAPTYKYRRAVLGRGRRRRAGRRLGATDRARGEREGGEEETHAGVVRPRVVARARRVADVVRLDARADAERPQARVQLVCGHSAASVPEETLGGAGGDAPRADAREMASQPRCAVLNPRAVFEDSIPYAEPRVTSFGWSTPGTPASWNSSPPCPATAARRRGCASRRQGHLLPGEETLITATTVAGGRQRASGCGAAGLGAGRQTPTRFASRTVRAFRMVKRFPKRARTAAALAPPRPRARCRTARLAQARAVSPASRVEAGGGVSMVSPAVVS